MCLLSQLEGPMPMLLREFGARVQSAIFVMHLFCWFAPRARERLELYQHVIAGVFNSCPRRRRQCQLELELIQTQMAQKSMLRAEVYAHASRASQDVKRAEV